MSDMNNHQGTSSSNDKKEIKDDEVTLGEVLRQQKELDDEYEQEYLEVLGGSDDKHCTYSQVKLCRFLPAPAIGVSPYEIRMVLYP